MRTTWTSRLQPGMHVPDFETILHNNKPLRSTDLKGKPYIFFFYNHDGSETCTKEACNVRDNFALLTESGYMVFGVSEDSVTKHQRFIEKYQLPYPLISDKDNVLAKTFDIFGQKEFMGRISETVHRTTFVINAHGVIEATIHPVDSARHVQQILESLSLSTT